MTFLLNKKVKTKNIANSVSKFAAENKLKPSQYNFNVNGVETYIKTVSDDDFCIYKEDIHNYYEDPEKIINEHVQFKQLYTITIKQEPKHIINLTYTIDYSDNNITPSIIIHPDSDIPYKKYKPKEIYLLLIKELNNIKAKKKILVKIFDTQMKNKLKAFIKHLYLGKFTKKIKIPLFDGIAPEITKSSRLIMHYLNKEGSHQVIEVDAKETLIEFRKPIFGKNGLNAFGEIISNKHGTNKGDIEAEIDTNSIEIVENEKKKLYKSKIKGYIHFDEKQFYIDNKIRMRTLSRVQDALAKDEANNIEVIISQNDTNIDSLGEGVALTSETIHINGHVGAKTTLEATNLTIEGATHQDSFQEAKFAEINRHKGKLRCHSAKIKLLEGGEVHATNINIESSLGGSIYAENVTIGHVKNNLKVYAANSITIKLVSGEDNLFKINYKDIPTLNSRHKFIGKDIDNLKYELEGAQKHTISQVPILKEKIKKLKAQQEEIENSAKDAKITIVEPLKGLNTIMFVLDEDNELTFKTEPKKYEPFYLKESQTQISLHPTDKKISIDS